MIWDAIVIATLVLSAILAFFRGFVREVLTIIGVIGGIAGAYYGGAAIRPFFRDMFGVGEGAEKKEDSKLFDLIPYEIVADALAYGIIFLIIVILLSVISHYLSSATKKWGLGIVDRSMGVVFGIVRGIILLGLLYMPVHIFVDVEKKKEWFSGARTIIYVELTADFMARFFPEFSQEPKKMYDGKAAKEVEKLLRPKSLDNEQDSQSQDSKDQKDDKRMAGPEDQKESENKSKDQGGGYNDKLREEMKNLSEEIFRRNEDSEDSESP